MEASLEQSKICQYYKDKHIMLTGATGLLGKLIIEKLLRVCKPAKIYLIVRTKKSKNPEDRLKELTQSPLFYRLKSEDSNFMRRLSIISGDVSQPGLGLSLTDAQCLIDKVQVVFHGAASVKFDESLAVATKINVLGTKTVLELCKKMKSLESMVHISTAYSHCPNKEIKEEFYKTPISSENLITLVESCGSTEIDSLTPCMIGKWPNTYVFTKAVAEEAVCKNGKDLPIAVFRPGIILTTRSDPVANWVDHIYGPIGMAYGCCLGAIRVLRMNKADRGEFLPADMTVSCLLAIGFEMATSRKLDEIPIYNFTSHPDNPATWGDIFRCMRERAGEIPYSKTFWHYSSTISIGNRINYYIVAFFLHILPALFIDIGLIACFKKPRALDIYKRIHNSMDLMGYFSTNTWKFSMDNTMKLWESLDELDQKLFDFDMSSIDYNPFLRGTIDGVMVNLLKEDDKNISYRRRRYTVIYIVHRFVQLLIYSMMWWSIWRITIYLEVPEIFY